jgi:cytochrome c553
MDLSLRRAQTAAASRGPRPQFIKVVGRQFVLQLAILSFVFFAAGAHAEDTDKSPVSKQELQAKLAYCENCHGVSVQGFHGYYPIPRLAGQQPEYLKNQVQAFVERRRTNNIMFNVSHVLSPTVLTALATSFHDLDPKPLVSAAPNELVAAGRRIYEEGLPDRDVPPCASCHGPEAKGDGQFPRLAGQLPDYVFNKLINWTKERGQNPVNPDTSAIMAPIAHGLNEQQIKAVAAYLNHIE